MKTIQTLSSALLLALLFHTASTMADETPAIQDRGINNLNIAPSKTGGSGIPGAKSARSFGNGAEPEVKEDSRVYNGSKSARVISLSDETKIESPYVAIPLLFKKDKVTLADAQSKANLKKVAAKMKELQEKDGAVFSIEGHSSSEGDPEHNRKLSIRRANSLKDELLSLHVPSEAISEAKGFGSDYAQFKDAKRATEQELQQDRRVLVVREK